MYKGFEQLAIINYDSFFSLSRKMCNQPWVSIDGHNLNIEVCGIIYKSRVCSLYSKNDSVKDEFHDTGASILQTFETLVFEDKY